MSKDTKQDYKITEINKPNLEKANQQINELCCFLEDTWELPVQTT